MAINFQHRKGHSRADENSDFGQVAEKGGGCVRSLTVAARHLRKYVRSIRALAIRTLAIRALASRARQQAMPHFQVGQALPDFSQLRSLTVAARHLPKYVPAIRALASRARQQAMPHFQVGQALLDFSQLRSLTVAARHLRKYVRAIRALAIRARQQAMCHRRVGQVLPDFSQLRSLTVAARSILRARGTRCKCEGVARTIYRIGPRSMPGPFPKTCETRRPSGDGCCAVGFRSRSAGPGQD